MANTLTTGTTSIWSDEFNYRMMSGWGIKMQGLGRDLDMVKEKWLVLSTAGTLRGTFEKEKAASQFIQKQVRENPNTRYILARAEKEVGAKSPEIEIEDIA